MNNSYKTKNLGKNKYGLHMLGAKEAFSIGLKITKLLPAGGSVLDAQTSTALDGLKFSTIASVLLDGFEDLDVEQILEQVVYSKIDCNGQDINPDTHFQGNLGEMVDVIAWALEVNFKSLFLESTYLRKILKTLKVMGFIPTAKVVEEVQEEEAEELKSE